MLTTLLSKILQCTFYNYFNHSDIMSDLELSLLEEKWEMVNQMEGNAIIFGKHGCLTDTSLHTVLKVRKWLTFAYRVSSY